MSDTMRPILFGRMSAARKDICRRFTVFTAGALICAIGIGFITRAGLGTSPISSLPFVLSLITPVSMGVYTLSLNLFFLLCESLLTRRFTAVQALQIPATLLFSLCVDGALRLIPSRYGGLWRVRSYISCWAVPSCP